MENSVNMTEKRWEELLQAEKYYHIHRANSLGDAGPNK
jgi:hypothetical protein